MQTTNQNFVFPFAVDPSGRIAVSGTGDDALRAKIIQILFTAPGERVHNPEFGCGLLHLVYEPNDDLLASAAEFTVSQALGRWLADEIEVQAVDVETVDESVIIEIAYTRLRDGTDDAVRIHFR